MASDKKAHIQILAVEKFTSSIIGNNNVNIVIDNSSIIDRIINGKYYCMPQRYLIDSQDKVCGDVSSSMQLKMIDEEIIFKIYTNALKILENKNCFQRMTKK